MTLLKDSDILSARGELYPFLRLIDALLAQRLSEEIFWFPSLEDLIQVNPEVGEMLTQLYRSNLPSSGKKGDVPTEIMAYQAAALSGAFFAYNYETGNYGLYTASPEILSKMDGGDKFTSSRIYEENMAGRVHCMRIDSEYASPGLYEVKATQLRTVTARLTLSETAIIPFIFVARLLKAIEGKLSQGRVLSITQTVGDQGTEKTRYVTINQEVLAEWSGNSDFAASLSPYLFLLKGWMYLPTVTAPATSLGLTRIEFFNIDRLKVVARPSLKRFAEKQTINPLLRTAQNEIISVWIQENLTPPEEDSPQEQLDFYAKFCNFFFRTLAEYDIFVRSPYWSWEGNPRGATILDNPSVLKLTVALTRLPDSVHERFWKHMVELEPDLELRLEDMKKILRGYQTFPLPVTRDQVYFAAQRGVVKAVAISKGCKFYSVIGTTNPKILQFVYGKDYVKRYESESVRSKYFRDSIDSGDLSIRAAEDYYGVKLADVLERESKERSRYSSPHVVSLRSIFATDGSRFYTQVNINNLVTFAAMTSRAQLT